MIAVISDSHIPGRAEEVPDEFYRVMDEASLVVHCGDFEKEKVYKRLDERYEDFIAVKGNCDFFELPVSETFEYDGVDFGVYHGTGIQPRGHPPTLAETANKLEAEVLFHGHTHTQTAQEKDSKVLLNPGTCTGAGGLSASQGAPKMMAVEVENGELVAELISLENGELRKEEERFVV